MDEQDFVRQMINLQLTHMDSTNKMQLLFNIQGETKALIFLNRVQGAIYAGDLSARMGLTSGRTANILKELEKKKLLTRQADPEDRRKVRIYITPEGKKEAERKYNQLSEQLTVLYTKMGEEEAKNLVEINIKILDVFHNMV